MAVNCGSSVAGGTSNVTINGCGCGGSGGSSGGSSGGGTGTGFGGGGSGGSPGSGPGGSSGSGPGGEPNTDGLDKRIVPPQCLPLSINRPYGSSGFEFANLSIKAAILATVALIPDYQPGDEVVSVMMEAKGLAYGGYGFLSNQPLVSNRKLTVKDGANETRKVAFKEEQIGAGIITFFGWRYEDNFNVIYGPNDITIDGQMPSALVPDINVDQNTPAWFLGSVCSAVVRHHKETSTAYGFNFSFDADKIAPGGIWDDSGVNVRAVFERYTHYEPNDTWNSPYITTGFTGGTPGQSHITLTQACDKAYTKLSGSFRHGNFGYVPALSLQMEEYDIATGSTIATLGTPHGYALPATTAAPGDYDNNLVNFDYEIEFPALTPGHYYRFNFITDATFGCDNLVGKFEV